MGVDIIGDVHGHADELRVLLKALGYVERAGAYRHPTNTALFLGDLIDRGPQQVDCIRIPRLMRDAGSAKILMGNHEFNAIAYATQRDDGSSGYLRPRTDPNTSQHAAFLGAVGVDTVEPRDVVGFFKTLPLWEETKGLREVSTPAGALKQLAPLLEAFTKIGRLRPAVFGQHRRSDRKHIEPQRRFSKVPRSTCPMAQAVWTKTVMYGEARGLAGGTVTPLPNVRRQCYVEVEQVSRGLAIQNEAGIGHRCRQHIDIGRIESRALAREFGSPPSQH